MRAPQSQYRKWILAATLAQGVLACGSTDAEQVQPRSQMGDEAAAGGSEAKGDGSGGNDASSSAGGKAEPRGGGGAKAEPNGGAGAAMPDEGSGGAASELATRAHCKRGLAYGYHSTADLKALSPGVSWWYNWDFRPDTDLRDGAYLEEEVEYLPMIWGATSDQDAALTNIPEDATHLLGFNEPHFGSQANISAQEAAALWPELEALADDRDLKLVSPAVNFCGGDCQDTDPFHYLEEFLAACEGCRIDAVAMHIYVGCYAPGENKAEWLIGHVESYKSQFDYPLWLTEFACNDAEEMSVQRAFLEDAVAYLEAEPRIERYAWFAGRADNMKHVDLLGADGELTELGQAYVDAPQDPDCTR